ncbi:Hypothetical predicted protein [Olea europaea subsp. europaea]|uniref:Uncharacterized protein n=1 Tax=Olea europaea subsp. europaea TaxID=158383 RepID=A0A8S0SLJ0_OLEEU|nr:Hypothetical predicted protein [Olea europaea subsp. europaea]
MDGLSRLVHRAQVAFRVPRRRRSVGRGEDGAGAVDKSWSGNFTGYKSSSRVRWVLGSGSGGCFGFGLMVAWGGVAWGAMGWGG